MHISFDVSRDQGFCGVSNLILDFCKGNYDTDFKNR